MHDFRLSADGRWLVIGYEDSTTWRFDLDAKNPATSAELLDVNGKTPVRSVAIHSDGHKVFIGRYEQENPVLWDLASEDADRYRVLYLRAVANTASVAAMSSSGQWLALGCDDGSVHLWDMTSESAMSFALSHMRLGGHKGRVQAIKFSPDSDWLVSTDGNTTCFWPLDLERLISIARRVAGRELSDEEKEMLAF